MTGYQVGQEVWVYEGWRTPEPRRGTIIRVGRTLVTIRYGRDEAPFRKDTACLNDRHYGSQTYFLTLEQAEAEARKTAALAVLREAGFEVRLGSRPDAELIEALAEVAKTFTEQEG